MSKPKKDDGLLVRMPHSLLNELRQYCEANDRSMAGVMRIALRQYLEREY